MLAVIPTEAHAHKCRCGTDTFILYEIKDPSGTTLWFEAACTGCGRHCSLTHKVTVQESFTIQEFATPEEAGMTFTAIAVVPGGRVYECDKCQQRSPMVRNGVELHKHIEEHHRDSPTCAFTVGYTR